MDSEANSTRRQTLIGTQLGKYQVRSEIGRGGMSTVYEAYDRTLDRLVALKVMAPHLTWGEEFVQRFLREARAAARLKHPNIITIYDVGRASGWYYFAMDYVKGKTLAKILREQGPMSVDNGLRILRQLAGALDYAHGQGLVHRDVKPSNVIVDDEGNVTLTDFGIARLSRATRLTRSGAVLGTPEYMAPEQASGGQVDHHTDQYALAVVAYELLAGKPPFEADSTPKLLYKIVHEGPEPLREVRPALPQAVDRVLARALAKDSEKRYDTCCAFVDALSPGLQQAVQADAPARREAAPPAEDRPRGRTKNLLLGLGGLGLLLVGLLCLIVAGIGIAIGLLAVGDREGASPALTDTLAPQPTTATASAPPQPTVTSRPRPTASDLPRNTPASQRGSILFHDDFGDLRSGWEIGDYEEGSIGYQNGTYSVISSGKLQWMWGVANQFFTDLIIEVDATQVSAGPEDNNDYGVACRVQPNGDGYHFVISGDGYYAVFVREERDFRPLLGFQESDVIRRGNAANRILAVCDGPELMLFVNGRHLATLEDTTFAGGDIALSATSYEDASTEILFDDLAVYATE